MKVAVRYYSKTGNTKKLAVAIAEGFYLFTDEEGGAEKRVTFIRERVSL